MKDNVEQNSSNSKTHKHAQNEINMYGWGVPNLPTSRTLNHVQPIK